MDLRSHRKMILPLPLAAALTLTLGWISNSPADGSSPQEQSMGIYTEAPGASQRLQSFLEDPTPILTHFKPHGIKSSAPTVTVVDGIPRVQFTASPESEIAKGVLRTFGLPTSYPVTLELRAKAMQCAAEGYASLGYRFEFKLAPSSRALAQDVSGLEFLFCQKQRPDQKLEMYGKGKVVLTAQAGKSPAGRQPEQIAQWQLWAFYSALKSALESQTDAGSKRVAQADSEALRPVSAQVTAVEVAPAF